MKYKVVILVAACVILACIFSAGCTSVQTDKPADTWINIDSDNENTQTLYLYADSTGKKETAVHGIVTKSREFTWERAGPYYTIVFTDDDDVDTFTLTNKTLVHDGHSYLPGKTELPANTTGEPVQDTKICGTWVNQEDTKTLVINEDGTGYRIKEKNKIKTDTFTWKKTGSHYYTLYYEDGEDDTLVYNDGELNRDGEIYTRN